MKNFRVAYTRLWLMMLLQVCLFSLPLNAQKKVVFSNSLISQASMLRLPEKGTNQYLEITALSKSSEVALIAFPGQDAKVVKGFKYLVSDGVLGFIGIIEKYWYKNQLLDTASIMVYISPEYGKYIVGYSVFKEDETLEEDSYSLNGVDFYNKLKSDKQPIFSVLSDQETYDTVLKWAQKRVVEYSE